VYRIAAIKLVLEGAPAFGYNDVPPAGLYRPLTFHEELVSFDAGTTWVDLSKKYSCDYKTLRLMNPHLAAQSTLSGGLYIFRTPQG
jgi:hypothetical protein